MTAVEEGAMTELELKLLTKESMQYVHFTGRRVCKQFLEKEKYGNRGVDLGESSTLVYVGMEEVFSIDNSTCDSGKKKKIKGKQRKVNMRY